MVSDHFEDRNARFAAILDRSAELTQRTEELLAEPRPEVTYEPPKPTRYRGFERETFSEELKATEARLNKRLDAIEARLSVRMDALEGRIQGMWNEMGELADEAGKATGELEKKLRDEMRKEVESLRGELTMLRAEMKASQPQRRKQTVSRAPWTSNEDVSLTN